MYVESVTSTPPVIVRQALALPESTGRQSRLASVDLLRGLAMVLMALDHTRSFFSFHRVPEYLAQTSGPLFFTRFLSHFCAPIFFLVAGTAGYLSLSQGKTVGQVSRFYWTRALWLIFLELTVVGYGWTYLFPFLYGGVLWALGCSMIIMAVVVWLPIEVIAMFGAAVVVLHNLFDRVGVAGSGKFSELWLILHDRGAVSIPLAKTMFYVLFPIIPWVGVMAVGYAIGPLLQRKDGGKVILGIGAAVTMAFLILRALHLYGNSDAVLHPRSANAAGPWVVQSTLTLTVISFLNTLKYPPSLQFLLMTLGPILIALVWLTRVNAENPASKILLTFGRVPLPFYILHIYLIHTLAVWVGLFGHQRVAWLLYGGVLVHPVPDGYGHGLPFVYAIWTVVLFLLYWPCQWFMKLKQERRDCWWLRYL